MDQEINKSVWLGSSLLMIVAAIGIALALFGVGRTIANVYITKLNSTISDTNYAELVELNNTTVNMTGASVVGLVERNGKNISKCTIYQSISATPYAVLQTKDNTLTAASLSQKIAALNKKITKYAVRTDLTDVGTVELIIYLEQ